MSLNQSVQENWISQLRWRRTQRGDIRFQFIANESYLMAVCAGFALNRYQTQNWTADSEAALTFGGSASYSTPGLSLKSLPPYKKKKNYTHTSVPLKTDKLAVRLWKCSSHRSTTILNIEENDSKKNVCAVSNNIVTYSLHRTHYSAYTGYIVATC